MRSGRRRATLQIASTSISNPMSQGTAYLRPRRYTFLGRPRGRFMRTRHARAMRSGKQLSSTRHFVPTYVRKSTPRSARSLTDNGTIATGTLLKGKRGLVLGIATERSIAYGISQVLAAQGAELAVTYQVDQLAGRVTALAEGLGASIVQLADVQNEGHLDRLFGTIEKQWNGLDFLVHSIAFS